MGVLIGVANSLPGPPRPPDLENTKIKDRYAAH